MTEASSPYANRAACSPTHREPTPGDTLLSHLLLQLQRQRILIVQQAGDPSSCESFVLRPETTRAEFLLALTNRFAEDQDWAFYDEDGVSVAWPFSGLPSGAVLIANRNDKPNDSLRAQLRELEERHTQSIHNMLTVRRRKLESAIELVEALEARRRVDVATIAQLELELQSTRNALSEAQSTRCLKCRSQSISIAMTEQLRVCDGPWFPTYLFPTSAEHRLAVYAQFKAAAGHWRDAVLVGRTSDPDPWCGAERVTDDIIGSDLNFCHARAKSARFVWPCCAQSAEPFLQSLYNGGPCFWRGQPPPVVECIKTLSDRKLYEDALLKARSDSDPGRQLAMDLTRDFGPLARPSCTLDRT